MTMIWDTIAGWLPWVAGLGGAVGVVGWFLGLPALLNILSTVLSVVAPLFQGLVAAVVETGRFWWTTILKPGLTLIFSSLAAVLTVVTIVGVVWTADYLNDKIRLSHKDNELAACRVQLKKAKATLPRKLPEPALWEFKWPF